jgi:hypothetical protein
MKNLEEFGLALMDILDENNVEFWLAFGDALGAGKENTCNYFYKIRSEIWRLCTLGC